MAPVFFLMTFSIIELGYFYFTKNALAGAVKQASIYIRTGEINNSPEDERAGVFRDAICDAAVLVQCQTRLSVDVRPIAGFEAQGSVLAGRPLDEVELSFDAGTALSIVAIEAIYEQPQLFGLIGAAFANENGDIPTSVVTFIRNEPI